MDCIEFNIFVSVPYYSSSTMWATWLEEKCSHCRTSRTACWEGTRRVWPSFEGPSPTRTQGFKYSDMLFNLNWKYNVILFKLLIFTSPVVHQVALPNAEPLIHFALNCGAKGCPPIKTYTPQVSSSAAVHLFVFFFYSRVWSLSLRINCDPLNRSRTSTVSSAYQLKPSWRTMTAVRWILRKEKCDSVRYSSGTRPTSEAPMRT